MSKSFDGLSNQHFVIKTNRNVLAVYYNPVKPDEETAYEGCDEGKIKMRLSSYVKNQNGSTRTTGYADFNLDIGQFEELEQMYELALKSVALVKLELAKGMPISLIEGKELVPRVYDPKVYDRVKDQAGNSPASIMTLEFQQFYKGEPKRNPFMLHIQQALGLQALQPAPTPVMQKAMEQARERDAKRQGYSQPGPAPMPQQGAPYQGQPGSMAMPPQGTPYQGQPGPVPMPQQGAPYQGPPMTGAMPPQGTVYPQGAAPQAPPMNGAAVPQGMPPKTAAPQAPPVTGAMPPQGMPPQGPAPQAPPVMGAMPPQGTAPQAPPAAGAPAQPQGEPMDLKILADQVVYLQSGASVMRCQDPAGVQMSLVLKGQPPREFLDAQKSGTPIKGRFAKKDLPGIGKCLVPA